MTQINEAYKPLYTSKKRYFLVTGGRGSLKSTSVHDFLSRLTFEVGHGVLFLRYTMTSAEKSIIPEFKEAIQRNNSYKLFQFRGDRVTNLKTGSFIMFAGVKTSSGNQTATLKSIPGLTTMVIDEGEEFTKEKDFDTIDDSIRSSEAVNRVIWIMNPTTPEHFIYKRWIEPANKKIKIEGFEVTISNLDTVEHIHTTYHLAEKAGYLPESWIDKANKSKENNPKHYYHNYIGGWLEKAEGAILPDWTVGTFDESLPFCYGLDFGFNPDPCGLIKVAIDKKNKKIYAEEMAYLQNLGTDDIEKLLKDRTGANEMIIADSAGKITIHDLRQRGLNVQACVKGSGSIISGLKKIMDYEIIVCGNSPNLKTELNNYIFNDKKAGIPIDKFNHLIDPLRYAFDRLSRDVGGAL
jgi:phage terminase large subunit